MKCKTVRFLNAVTPPGSRVREPHLLTSAEWDLYRDGRNRLLWITPKGKTTPAKAVELHNVLEYDVEDEELLRVLANDRPAQGQAPKKV